MSWSSWLFGGKKQTCLKRQILRPNSYEHIRKDAATVITSYVLHYFVCSSEFGPKIFVRIRFYCNRTLNGKTSDSFYTFNSALIFKRIIFGVDSNKNDGIYLPALDWWHFFISYYYCHIIEINLMSEVRQGFRVTLDKGGWLRAMGSNFVQTLVSFYKIRKWALGSSKCSAALRTVMLTVTTLFLAFSIWTFILLHYFFLASSNISPLGLLFYFSIFSLLPLIFST